MIIRYFIASVFSFSIVASVCSNDTQQSVSENLVIQPKFPASVFDLSHWAIQVPVDDNQDAKADRHDVIAIQTYEHVDFFRLNEQGQMVFVSPNKAVTTKTSTNTRSELRYMSRGVNMDIATADPRNNFALAANEQAADFASIGAKMEATLHVDHVSINAGQPDKYSAFSAVVGQIHALKLDEKKNGFGHGNEPLKIFYKKWPNHNKGSVFWTYEPNLPKDDPNRVDVAYAVWGNSWDDSSNPGENGVALGEEFSYTVNVYQNTMQLTFSNARHGEVSFSINLANNIDAKGQIDIRDHPFGYAGEPLYFKAGLYNQCSTKVSSSFRYPACPGTGDWITDFEDGNYAQATFTKLQVSVATPIM